MNLINLTLNLGQPLSIKMVVSFGLHRPDNGVYKLDQNKILHHYKFDPLNPFSIPTSNFEFTDGVRFAT